MGGPGYSDKPMTSGSVIVPLPETTASPTVPPPPTTAGPTIPPSGKVVPEEILDLLARTPYSNLSGAQAEHMELMRQSMEREKERFDLDQKLLGKSLSERYIGLFTSLVGLSWAAKMRALSGSFHDATALMDDAIDDGETMLLKIRERINTLSEAGVFADKT